MILGLSVSSGDSVVFALSLSLSFPLSIYLSIVIILFYFICNLFTFKKIIDF